MHSGGKKYFLKKQQKMIIIEDALEATQAEHKKPTKKIYSCKSKLWGGSAYESISTNGIFRRVSAPNRVLS